MARMIDSRVCAEIDDDFVLFPIGIRINRPWKVGVWMPVFRAMPKTLEELSGRPELGLMHYRSHVGFPNSMPVQYWRSFDQLQDYATARDHAHLPAWRAFNRAVGTSGDVGIWHETFLIGAGRSESIYVNMPPYGLGRIGRLEAAEGSRAGARTRLRGGGVTTEPPSPETAQS